MSRGPTVALVEFGPGNPASVMKAFAAAGASVYRAASPDQIKGAEVVVIPGVGHFGATSSLDDEWRQAITSRLTGGATLFGICLGMQWLFDGSEEAVGVPGLGLFRGRCFRLRGEVKVPHVGWNLLRMQNRASPLFDGIPRDASMYFTHTFAAPVVPESTAVTTHGTEFSAVVERGRVIGTQFHPEKSGSFGLRLLANLLASSERSS